MTHWRDTWMPKGIGQNEIKERGSSQVANKLSTSWNTARKGRQNWGWKKKRQSRWERGGRNRITCWKRRGWLWVGVNKCRKAHKCGWEITWHSGEEPTILNPWRGEWDWTHWGSSFHRQVKIGINEWKWAVSLDFGNFTRSGLLVNTCAKNRLGGWVTGWGRGWQSQKGGVIRQRGHQSACNATVTCPEIQLHRRRFQWFWGPWFPCNQFVHRWEGGRQPKGESSNPSSYGWRPCKLINAAICQGKTARWRMPSHWLALEANLAIWFAQKKIMVDSET